MRGCNIFFYIPLVSYMLSDRNCIALKMVGYIAYVRTHSLAAWRTRVRYVLSSIILSKHKYFLVKMHENLKLKYVAI